MAPIRVGMIGLSVATETSGVGALGSWGVNAHLRSIQGLSDEYEIVAVANSTVESAQRSIEFHKLPENTKAYGNPEDIAADPNVDLIVISVEVRKHHLLAIPALKHKKSVFVEWPLGANLAQAEELTKLASANGVKNMVGLQGRSDPLVQKVKEILATGKIGEVTSSTVTVCSSIFFVEAWLKDIEFYLDFNSGGNEFTILFGHFLDSFTYLLGDFTQVQGLLKSQINTIPIIDPSNGQVVNPAYHKTAPDSIFVQGTLENDALASIVFRKARSAADNVGFRWYITGTEGEIVITTEEGVWQHGISSKRSIKLKIGKEGETEQIDFSTGDISRASKVPSPGTNTARQYESFAKPDGEVVTFESALKTHRLLEKIAKSAGWEL
ncbi:hypothetical protein G7Y89_g9105 [Cudoniella acicularis]|uniref:Gfo/Idh/MocA-like oxidoreductase N-terminal domain-containing protein n=1 Tax=Cudoniella acicularis TaxID=354080 RepID=A0A8H4RFA5_9HELO|nr:hypothetical protein G7Y89_g9105 [Cudoniella acicularis]